MAATLLLLLSSLLLVTPVTPSHFFGGRSSVTVKGRNPDGTWKVVIRDRSTFDGCNAQSWHCHSGNCGSRRSSTRTNLDTSPNSPVNTGQWCETETVSVRHVQSDRPFSLRATSCCWIPTQSNWIGWRLRTNVDLGQRSDTNKPNGSPDVGILPLIRVPQNCPRIIQLMPSDPDGDHVRCRYGNVRYMDCHQCRHHSGFQLDQDSCTLRYQRATANTKVRAFELVAEDFPRATVTLRYTNGPHSTRFPPHVRRRRSIYGPWWSTTSSPVQRPWWATRVWRNPQGPRTAAPPVTAAPPSTPLWFRTTISGWWNPQGPRIAAPPVTAAPPSIPLWFRTTTSGWWNTQGPRTAAPPATPIPNWFRPNPTAWWNTQQITTMPQTTDDPRMNTVPLSKVPLQFSFLVDPPAPSCQEGVYIPRLLPPTPQNGARIEAVLDSALEITVKARSSVSSIIGVIFSGPRGMTKQQRSQGEFVLRWTPTSAEAGMKVPLCFAVEAGHGQQVVQHFRFVIRPSRLYQSQMRCVMIEVAEDNVRRSVSCSQSTMTIAIEKASLPGLRNNHLQLSDPSNVVCSFQTHSNSTHAVATFPLNACGTQIEENSEKLIFKNEVTSADNPMALITRKHLLELDFFCEYPKHGNVTLGFRTHRANVTVWEKGFGMFTYDFEFYNSGSYRAMINPSSYPVEVDVGSRIYMQIEATSSVNNTELFVESCRASPYDNPNYTPTYSIIDNGCAVDQTVTIHAPAHPNQFRFSMEAFKFIGLHDQVYISCSVVVCQRGNRNTRCSRGCVRNIMSRTKREANIQTSNHFISQGPLRLRRSAEAATSTDAKLNLNLVFIVGALLAAVATVSVTSYLKKRISGAKYRPLPTEEQ